MPAIVETVRDLMPMQYGVRSLSIESPICKAHFQVTNQTLAVSWKICMHKQGKRESQAPGERIHGRERTGWWLSSLVEKLLFSTISPEHKPQRKGTHPLNARPEPGFRTAWFEAVRGGLKELQRFLAQVPSTCGWFAHCRLVSSCPWQPKVRSNRSLATPASILGWGPQHDVQVRKTNVDFYIWKLNTFQSSKRRAPGMAKELPFKRHLRIAKRMLLFWLAERESKSTTTDILHMDFMKAPLKYMRKTPSVLKNIQISAHWYHWETRFHVLSVCFTQSVFGKLMADFRASKHNCSIPVLDCMLNIQQLAILTFPSP